jgi:hypothetical protein
MKASGYFSHRQVFSNKFQSSKKKHLEEKSSLANCGLPLQRLASNNI